MTPLDTHFLIELPDNWPQAAKELIASLIDQSHGVEDTYADDWNSIRCLEVVIAEGEDQDCIRETLEPFTRKT